MYLSDNQEIDFVPVSWSENHLARRIKDICVSKPQPVQYVRISQNFQNLLSILKLKCSGYHVWTR